MSTIPFWSTSPPEAPVLKFENTMIRSVPSTTPSPSRSAVSCGDTTLTVTVAWIGRLNCLCRAPYAKPKVTPRAIPSPIVIRAALTGSFMAEFHRRVPVSYRGRRQYNLTHRKSSGQENDSRTRGPWHASVFGLMGARARPKLMGRRFRLPAHYKATQI